MSRDGSGDDDPFGMFGESDDEDEDEDNGIESSGANHERQTVDGAASASRDEDCGVLAFHAGTEQALLRYVEAKLEVRTDDPSLQEKTLSPPEFVLNCIDEFCSTRHWMMHIGATKGSILSDFLRECVEAKGGPATSTSTSTFDREQPQRRQEGGGREEGWQRPLTVIELGTYCGYAAILMATTLRHLRVDFQIVSVEVVKLHVDVSRSIIHRAGFDAVIEVLDLSTDDRPANRSLPDAIRQAISVPDSAVGRESASHVAVQADFVFIDHDKSLYKKDLVELEQAGLVGKGTYVAADNVVFAGIEDYRSHMRQLQKKGAVSTRLEATFVEYSENERHSDQSKIDDLRDGIELSVYIENPPER